MDRTIVWFTLPLLVVRAYSLVVGLDGSAVSPDLAVSVIRGIISDVALGVVWSLLAHAILRNRYAFYSIWFLWVVLHALNIEHINVHRANMDYSFFGLAANREFIFGSVISAPVFLKIGLSLTFSILIVSLYDRIVMPLRLAFVRKGIFITSAACAVLVLLPVSHSYPYWVQMNFVEENAKDLLKGNRQIYRDIQVDQSLYGKFLPQDVSGIPVIPYPSTTKNVLLIILEGISHQASTSKHMPFLTELHSSGISYENFISLQMQTNRGIYALLCNDWPNFLTKEAKSDIVGQYGVREKCFPEILRENGYSTVFMQGAPLGYMRKDRFAEKAGFSEIVGASGYPVFRARSNWGVDDETLYLHVLEKIGALEQREKPWFVSLLTVSAHHPYLVPENESPSEHEVLGFVDSALRKFIGGLQARGLLGDTLVIITADEAVFAQKGRYSEQAQKEISMNHAALVVLAPQSNGHLVRQGIFSQADIALSVLDYLGLDLGQTSGRSLFREYKSPRPLVFGNVYTSKIYSVDGHNILYTCSLDLECSAYSVEGRSIFNSPLETADVDNSYLAELEQVLSANELDSTRSKSRYVFLERNKRYEGSRWLLGDHKLILKKGQKVSWHVNMKAVDDIRVQFSVEKVEGNPLTWKAVHQKDAIVKSGDTLEFTLDYEPGVDEEYIWSKMVVFTSTQSGEYFVKEVAIKRGD